MNADLTEAGAVDKEEISVALCTFNGARFLARQLDSLAKQTVRPAEIVVCDDGSSDETLDILTDFAGRAIFPVRVYENMERLGVVANFSKAISLCQSEYVAICDQDDIWLPQRLEKTSLAMKEAESKAGKDKPLLVHSDLKIGDSGGRVIASSFMQENKIGYRGREPLKRLLVQNFVTGCTVLLNRSLLEAALPIPDEAPMHDWWLALVAATRGKLVFVAEPTVIYRQHDLNVIGSRSFFSAKTVVRLADLTALERDMAASVKQGLALQARLAELFDEDKDKWQIPKYLITYLNKVQQGGVGAACTAMRFRIGKTPWLRNILFLLLLTRGSYVDYL